MDNVQAMEAKLLALAAGNSEIGPINDVLEIDAESRTITIPSTELIFGVVTDKNSERKYFRCPRIVGNNLDLSTLGLRVLYQNANNESDKYIVRDCVVDGDYVMFSWLIEGKALKYSGVLHFAVAAVKVDNDGNTEIAWSTTAAMGTVLTGIEVDDLDEIEEKNSRDVLQQLLNIMDSEMTEATQNVKNEGAAQIKNVQNEGTAQIKNVQNEGAIQMKAVSDKGLETLDSIPEDYTHIDAQVKHNTRYTSPVIRQDAEGNGQIGLTDSANMHLLGLTVYGKSIQNHYTGKNRLPIRVPSRTYNGITYTVNEDGSINVSGTAKGYSWLSGRMEFGDERLELIPAGEYFLSGSKGDSTYYGYINGWYVDGEAILQYNDMGNGVKIVLEKDAYIYYQFMVSDGKIVNTTIYPQLERGSSPTSFERYTGGIPSPNPDYPQDIVSVENPAIYVRGKNAVNFDTPIKLVSGGMYIVRECYIKGPFTVSYEVDIKSRENIGATFMLLEFSDGSVTYVVHLDDGHSIGKHSYNNANNKTLIKVTLLNWDRFIGDLKWVQVESGMEATEYEPYVEMQTINSTFDGLGIPVKSGGNHIDENGQQWIVDYRDWERGVDVQMLKSIVINGESAVHKNVVDTSNYLYYMYIINDRTKLNNDMCLCDRLSFYDIATINAGGDKEHCGMHLNSKGSILYFNVGHYTSENTIEAVKRFLTENPLTIIYAIETPIETPIPEDELLAYRATHTNYLHTNVLNDSGAYMKLAYATDTKTYIDNKFEELRAAISNNS